MASSTPEATASLRRVGEIVLAAATLDPGEREAFLRQLTLREPALLAEVRRRLELAAALPESFLAIPAAELLASAEQAVGGTGSVRFRGPAPSGAPRSQAPVPGAGRSLDPAAPRYEVGDCVGEGGMARVHKAFDRQLERPVALKFLSRQEADARRRFLAEAHAQARVRHDNVLDVYEIGELDGRPFLALRWVDGPTLAALCGNAGETVGMSLEQKVRLVAQVAAGLHEAHRGGLIHRDVKPANILVERTPDGDWKPWVADFGIAESQEAGATGGLAGTPAYLAPELLDGGPGGIGGRRQADRRADVYSLGVTFYEFLTGETPFRSPDLAELLRQIREEAPPSPREILPGLPAEIEAIVLKCLEKDPAARYLSARALAEDLERFLNGDPVLAHAATFAYRLTKLVTRHRRLLTVAGVAAVLLVLALGVAAVLGVEARLANRRAERRRGQAEDLIGFMLTDLRGKLDRLGKLDLLDDVGKRAMGYFAAVPKDELSKEELARRSQALYQIGDVRIKRGDLTGALPPLEESLGLAQALADREPTPERLFGLGQSQFWVGYVHWERGDLAAARPHFLAYRDLSERLVRIAPRRPEYQLELAYADSNLGSLERQAGDLAPALASFEKTLALKAKLVAARPADRDLRFELAATHDLLGQTLIELGRLNEARPHFAAQLALLQALVEADPGSFRFAEFLGTAHDSLATWHEARGEVAAALESALRSQEIFARLVARDPANQLWRWELALARMKEGRLDRLQGESRQALSLLAPLAENAARHVVEEPGDRRWRLLAAWAELDLAAAQADLGQLAAARTDARRAVDGLSVLAQRQPQDRDLVRGLAKALLLLGQLERRRGDAPAAKAAWERARSLLEPAVRRSGSTKLLDPWAAVLLRLGRRDEALPILGKLAASDYRPRELVNLCREEGIDLMTKRYGLRWAPRTGDWLRGAPEGAGPQDPTEPAPRRNA